MKPTIQSVSLAFLLCIHSFMYAQSPYNFTAVNKLIQDSASARFGGSVVVLVQKNDSLILWSNPNLFFNPLSQTQIASASKWISAAVLLSVVDDGLVSLDDTIGKYLPLFTLKKKGNITIRQCFSHTSGLPGGSYPSAAPWPGFEFNGNLTLGQAVDSIALKVPLQYKPGKGFGYSNLGMHVVGRIMEIVTGQCWDTLFAHRIANKCEMINTSYTNNTPTHPVIAGGITTTANDYMNFLKMILHNGMYNNTLVLSPASVNEMFKDQTNKAPVLDVPSVYPCNPPFHPYNADTVRYGIGTWQDVVNPSTGFTEQISSPGFFSTYPWVDRCRNIRGVIFTFTLVNDLTTRLELQIIDMIRKAVGGGCNASTTVDEIKDSSVGLYPNPVTDKFTITFNNSSADKRKITLTDIAGREINSFYVNGSESEITVDVSAFQLDKGLYLVRIDNKNSSSYLKIIIQ